MEMCWETCSGAKEHFLLTFRGKFQKLACKINGRSFPETEADSIEEQIAQPRYKGGRCSEILETDRLADE